MRNRERERVKGGIGKKYEEFYGKKIGNFVATKTIKRKRNPFKKNVGPNPIGERERESEIVGERKYRDGNNHHIFNKSISFFVVVVVVEKFYCLFLALNFPLQSFCQINFDSVFNLKTDKSI